MHSAFQLTRATLAALFALLYGSGCASQGTNAASAKVSATASAPHAVPIKDYLVYVVSEAADKVTLVRFGPSGARVDHDVNVGLMPADVDGPHGIAVSPDKRFYYITTAHGTPFGALWKYTTHNDSLVGRVELGNFPATLQLSPDGEYAYVVNFNLHGDMVPSSVSIVATEGLLEVARVTTCTMPHGSRVNAQGTKQYSACMMDDMLVEIDMRTFGVSRHFMLNKGKEHGMPGAPRHSMAAAGAASDMSGHGMEGPKPGDVTCSPTWAQPSADGSRIYVACNKSSEIVEIDTDSWTVGRRLPAGDGVYNLAATNDGRLLVATNKRGQSVSVFEISTGKELVRLSTRRKVVHGVAISSDDRYAFISVEGIGSEPGTVEIVDLVSLKTVATVDVRQQAGGIDFWKTETKP